MNLNYIKAKDKDCILEVDDLGSSFAERINSVSDEEKTSGYLTKLVSNTLFEKMAYFDESSALINVHLENAKLVRGNKIEFTGLELEVGTVKDDTPFDEQQFTESVKTAFRKIGLSPQEKSINDFFEKSNDIVQSHISSETKNILKSIDNNLEYTAKQFTSSKQKEVIAIIEEAKAQLSKLI